MSQFNNVTIIKKANINFDGHVTSRIVLSDDGFKVTLGIMLPGVYEFKTNEKEVVEILSGSLEVQLPRQDWKKISRGESFEVPENSSFKSKVHEVTDYCCRYIQ